MPKDWLTSRMTVLFRHLRLALPVMAVLLLAACRWSPSTTTPLRLSGATMGTSWSVTLGRLPADTTRDQLQLLLQQRLDRINALMSTYDPASELTRFNDQRSSDWFPVAAETAAVVALAQQISRQTGGAFDVTVGPLVDLWGFGPLPRASQPPTAQQIEQTRRRVGYRHLQVRRSPAALRKTVAGLRVDLSAIAKGYAVDQLAELLAQHGVHDALVEIGGELRLLGHRLDGQPWRIAIERPEPGSSAVEKLLALQPTAVATSGNYRNFYQAAGQRYAHTIDPTSGYPTQHRLASATVLAPSAAQADALATALMVMGEQRARAFCKREGIAALLLIHQGSAIAAETTPGFRALTATERK